MGNMNWYFVFQICQLMREKVVLYDIIKLVEVIKDILGYLINEERVKQ
jgi:hypothetical protein